MYLQSFPWASLQLQIIMQLFVVGTMLYLFYKYKHDLLIACLILLCYASPFIFLGKNIQNAYKVGMLVLVVYTFVQRQAWKTYRVKDTWFTIAFVLLTLQFFLATLFYSSNTWTIIFSQYTRYVEIYLLLFLLKDAIYVRGQKDKLLCLFYDIMLMQIFISCVKWLLFRRQIESLVGSFSIIGGAMGTTIPILGFIILWFYRKGKFTWKDWLYLAGLFFLGFTTGKRAVMFILPLVVAAFMIYVKGIRLNKYMIMALCCVPFLFYFGVRLTPTLNPEHKVWGSFDIDYAFNYAETYQFGEKGIEGQRQQDDEKPYISYSNSGFRHGDQIEAEGRGGATIALVKLIFSERRLTDQDLWGIGFKNMYGVDYDEFDKLPLTIHINHKGSATGVFQSYVTTGVLGALCTIIFCFLPFFYCKHRRLRWVLLGITFWEYFLYTGMIFRTPIFMVVVFFVIFYANQEYYQTKKAVKVK